MKEKQLISKLLLSTPQLVSFSRSKTTGLFVTFPSYGTGGGVGHCGAVIETFVSL